jgi:DNA-binding winged helix-turn-helix (wHTH) protein/TolB-like protein/tetratricopeptide (TPR) repeat protein
MASEIKRYYEFGSFRFDAQKLSLEFGNENVSLPPKSLRTLKVLLEHRGETVAREALMSEIWQETFVEDSNLTVAVSTLRKTLALLSGPEVMIQTVPREGYRFIADVNETVHISEQPLVVEKYRFERLSIADERLPARSLFPIHRPWLVLAAPAILCLAVVSAALHYFSFGSHTSDPGVQKLAVLPLRSLDTSADERAVRLGFADSMITRLAGFANTEVASLNTVSGFLDTDQDPTEIGRKLGVDLVVDGSLYKANGTTRLNVRLIRTNDGKQSWSGSFDIEDGSLFRHHDRIARSTAQALGLKAGTPSEQRIVTQNVDAYHSYLMGEYFLRLRGWNVMKSVPYFERAIELDPGLTRAYIGLATVHATNAARLEKAEAALAKAAELDENLAEVHALRGFIAMFHHWNWNEAERSFDRAIELDPASIAAYHWRGEYRKIRGRFDQAEDDLLRALELDPLSPVIRADLAELYYFAGNDHGSIRQNEQVLAIDPTNQAANMNISRSLNRLGDHDEAFHRYLEFSIAYRNFASKDEETKYRSFMAELYRKGGMKAIESRSERIGRHNSKKADDFYKRLRANIGLSMIELKRGEHQAALDRLSSVVAELNASGKPKNFILYTAAVNPAFEPVRNTPRFRRILAQMNLLS